MSGLGFLDRRSPYGQFTVSGGGGGQGAQGVRVYTYKPYTVNVYARMWSARVGLPWGGLGGGGRGQSAGVERKARVRLLGAGDRVLEWSGVPE